MLLNKNFQMEMLKELVKLNLDAYQSAIYLYLMKFYQKNFSKKKYLITSKTQLSKDLKISRPKVEKALKELSSDELGLINIKVLGVDGNKGIQISTTYCI